MKTGYEVLHITQSITLLQGNIVQYNSPHKNKLDECINTKILREIKLKMKWSHEKAGKMQAILNSVN